MRTGTFERRAVDAMIRKVRGLLLFCLMTLLWPGLLLCQSGDKPKTKEEKPSGFVTLRVEVTGGEKNQPVESASVYVRYIQPRALKKGKKVELNVKTNREGTVRVPDVPRGKVQVQVVADGWKPFGRWYEVEEEGQTIQIHLEKPPRWY